jgi:hypothetical protein
LMSNHFHLLVRAGIVKSIKELNEYPRSGHSVLMGNIKHYFLSYSLHYGKTR